MKVSSYFKPTMISGEEVYKLGSHIYKAQVQRVIYPDMQDSLSKIDVEYDLLVEISTGVAQFKNVPSLAALGGFNDYEETIFEPNEASLSGKNDATNTFQNKNGSLVAVAFFGGNYQRPLIIGAFSHPKNQRRTSKDGISHVKVFRGVKTEINKDGEWSVTYQSPNSPDGKPTAAATGPSFIKLNKAGGLVFSLKDGTIKQTNDVDAEKTDFDYKSGLKVTFDGKTDKVTMLTKGGTKIEIDGNSLITLTAGSSIIKIDGSSGKIELSGNLVDVGTGASALAVLGPQLSAWLASHTHIGNLGFPTSPPVVPPPATILSQSVKIKA